MLEGFRRHSNSLFIVLLVASVATIFGVNWGPGSQGCRQGNLQVVFAAKVYGNTLAEADFVASAAAIPNFVPAYLAENPAVSGAIRQGALDGLIERELLAHEAERLGMRVTEQQVNEEFRSCRFYLSVGAGAEDTIGIRSGMLPLPPTLCGGVGDQFDFQVFERTVRRFFRRTVADFRVTQAREILADRMRRLLRASVQVSDEEMWRDYQRSHDQMAVHLLRFSLAFHRNLVRDDDSALVGQWAAAHAPQVQQQWERRRDSLRGLQREIRVRHILVKYPEGATDAQKAEARTKADAILVRVRAGEDFVRLARLYSEDDGSWRNGGELGWRRPDGEQGYVAEFSRAAAALQVGGTSPLVETRFGLHIIQLLGTREGNVTEADAKADLARGMYRETRATELVTQAARQTLERLRGGATLAAVSTEIRAGALREFYRGETAAPQALAGGVSLAAVARTDLDPPEARESEQFARNGSVISDLENGEQLTRTAFTLTQQQPYPAEPAHVGDDWFVLRFKDGSRTVATREQFQRERQELLANTYASMLAVRQREAVVSYIARLRQEAEHAGQVRIGNSPRLRAPAANTEQPEE